MLTAVKHCVSWCYREDARAIRRTLHSYHVGPCVEAARIISGNPHTFDIEVIETDTGKVIDWKPEGRS
jgi:hypothetical protein